MLLGPDDPVIRRLAAATGRSHVVVRVRFLTGEFQEYQGVDAQGRLLPPRTYLPGDELELPLGQATQLVDAGVVEMLDP
jgi:hypothetical protein